MNENNMNETSLDEQIDKTLKQYSHEECVEIVRKHNVRSWISKLPAGYEIRSDVGNGGYQQAGYSTVHEAVSKKLSKRFPFLDNAYVVIYATFHEPFEAHRRYGFGLKWAERTMLKKAGYVAEKAMDYRNKRLEEEVSSDI